MPCSNSTWHHYKTEADNITSYMTAVHPAVAGGWLAAAAAQAKSRLDVGDMLGAPSIVEIIHTQGDTDAALVLDSQAPNTLAEVFEYMARREVVTHHAPLSFTTHLYACTYVCVHACMRVCVYVNVCMSFGDASLHVYLESKRMKMRCTHTG